MMEAKGKKWCPQHGYPLPCDKCGVPLTQQKEIYKAGMREVVEWIKNNSLMMCQGIPNMTNVQILSSAWQAQLKVWFKDNPELLKEWGL